MARQFENQIVLVTGGATGIGRATALEFAREGAKVAVADSASKEGRQTVEQIEATGATARFFRVDVSKTAEVERLIQEVVGTWDRLDVVFNNAGTVGKSAAITETPEADFDRVIGVNLKGVWLCMKYAIAQMMTQGGGIVINMGSALSFRGRFGASAYVASKHGVAGLTRACAIEYGRHNIRINAICPGMIRTPMHDSRPATDERESELVALHPAGRLGTVEDIASCVLWLASAKAAFVHGALISVDGGWTAQ